MATLKNRLWAGPVWTLFIITVLGYPTTKTEEDFVSTAVVEAVIGKTAELPCDIVPDTNDDRVYMVLWFRDTGGKPIYSFDVRGRPFEQALHWSDPDSFDDRARFMTFTRPAILTVNHVQLDDEGIYRCRVDFKNSPTRNIQIKLKIIVTPHKVMLYDTAGKDVSGVIGPMEVGGRFTVFCEVRGGRPQPIIRWLFNNEMIEDHSIVKEEGKVLVSKVTLTDAKRNWLNKTLRCQAPNNLLIAPPERSARIEMNLAPTSVAIIDKPSKLYAGLEFTFICVAYESRPPPEISWFKDNRPYPYGKQSENTNSTAKVSRFTYKPLPEDHSKNIKCRAVNTVVDVAMEDNLTMHVVYKPVVNLTLGSTLQPNEIKEGDDVYFECHIKANPKEYKISWYHDAGTKKLIEKTPRRKTSHQINIPSSAILTSTKSLVLQKVDRSHAGLYSCSATNELGETSSPQLYLRIQYTPVCSQTTPMLIGARLDEQLRIRCVVKADPADVNFTWLFNNSGENFEVSPHRYGPTFMVSQGGTASELRYSASSDRDYGTLTCVTRNIIGDQIVPCTFHVVPAARPSPPSNCTAMKVLRKAEPLLAIRCVVGYDGGMRQHFTLESTGSNPLLLVNTSVPYDDDGRPIHPTVWLNVTWSLIEDLTPNQRLLIFARNARGLSEPIILQATLFNDEIQINEVTAAEEGSWMPIVVALTAVVVLLGVGGAAAVAFFRKRREVTSTLPTTPTSKAVHTVVQIDDRGRRRMFTCPEDPDKEGKPDILLPRTGTNTPRVVLAEEGSTFVTITGDTPPQRREDAAIDPR